MDNFIILKRIGKNDKEYLLWILDLDDKKIKYIVYDRKESKVISKIPISEDFVDFTTGKKFDKSLNLESFDADLDEYNIHKFDYDSSPKIRSIQYSIKRKDSKEVFIPCCGRYKDHDTLKKFSNYTHTFQIFEEVFIEGYILTDHEAFDTYITKIDPKKIILDYTGNTEILFRELRDYIGDFFIDSYKEVEITMSHPSGRKFVVNI